MIIYNKLVRDKIPNIIEQNGETCHFKTLNQVTFTIELQRKLKEEVNEYLESKNGREAMEELADILEVIHSLAETHDKSFEDIEKLRQLKLKERGGFKEKYYLISKMK